MQTLDISTFDNNPDYNDTQFISELESKTAGILRRVFPTTPQKQQIKKDVNGLVVACPYCHDSATSVYKKRGHILIRGKWAGHYKCFNCNAFTTIPQFMTDFDESLSLSGLKFVQEHRNADIMTINSSSNEITADVFCKELALKYGVDRDGFREYLQFVEITNTYIAKQGYEYLLGRLQFGFDNFMYDPKTNSIVILNICDRRVIGCQLRRLGKNIPKSKRFLTYNLGRMYSDFFKRPDIVIPQEIDTISTLFGVYKINVYKPIIVTEGPMDSFLLPNAIATAGANKHMAVDLPFYYMFDADKTGQKHAIEKMKEHCKVFLWGKLKKDLNLPKREKWDVNDVVLYVRQKYGNDYKIDWLKYFSDNLLDAIYLENYNI